MNFISGISDTNIKEFDDVLTDYGIEKWQIIGDYKLIETEEIPIYEFDFIWKVDIDNIFSKILGYFKKIFRISRTSVKVPAVEMSDEDWIEYGHLFIRPIKDVLARYHMKEKDVLEYKLTNKNGLPSYWIKTKMIEPGPDGEPWNVRMTVPAIYMGAGTNDKGTFNRQLGIIWNGGEEYLIKLKEVK